jgi:hypothetical protein
MSWANLTPFSLQDGELRAFDDSYLHSAENKADKPRYILHVTFPHPDLLAPRPALAGSAAAAIATTATAHVRLDFFADCGVQVTRA